MNLRHMKHSFFFFFCVLLVILLASGIFTKIALSEEKTNTLRMRWVIDEALRTNPELQAAKLRWEASKEKVPQARALDDPTLGFTYYGEQVQTRVGEIQAGITASQKIPFYGKLRLKGEIAENEAMISEEKYRTLEREVIAKAKSAFYELYCVYKSIMINEENKELLQRFAKIAEIKYATGKARQQDVLKAQVELSKIVKELITLEQLNPSSTVSMRFL